MDIVIQQAISISSFSRRSIMASTSGASLQMESEAGASLLKSPVVAFTPQHGTTLFPKKAPSAGPKNVD
jgi:hypothetical protein